MNDHTRILAALRHYVDLQATLLTALRAAFGREPGPEIWLGDVPKRGEVLVRDRTWDFVRHGGGVRFSEQGSARQVDVLDRVDRPDLFDRWRLVTYFGSLQRTGIKLLEHATRQRGLPFPDALDLLLPRLIEAGVVVESEGRFMLVTRV